VSAQQNHPQLGLSIAQLEHQLQAVLAWHGSDRSTIAT
jgi:predicted HD phosphohydrolase